MTLADLKQAEKVEMAHLVQTRVSRHVALLLTGVFLAAVVGMPLVQCLHGSPAANEVSTVVADVRHAAWCLLRGPFPLFRRVTACNAHLMLAIRHIDACITDRLSARPPRIVPAAGDTVVKPDSLLGWTFVGHRAQADVGLGGFDLRFNRFGMRGGEVPSGPVPLLILGNSITMAQHVPEEKTFACLLGAVNAGFDGYNTFQQRDKFRRDLLTLEPRCVGLVVSPHDIASEETTRTSIRRTLDVNRSLPGAGVRVPAWMELAYGQIMSLFGAEMGEDPQRMELAILNRVRNPIPDAEWDDWTRALLDIKRLTGSGRFFVIYMPPRVEVRVYRRQPGAFAINARLKQFCAANGLPLLDLLGPLALQDPDMIYLDRVHFNERGHATVAQQVSGFVKALARGEPAGNAGS